MMEDFLKARLGRLIRRHQQIGLWRKLSLCWGLAALVGLGFLYVQAITGWSSDLILPLLGALAFSVSIGVMVRHAQSRPDERWAARLLESRHPELEGVLLTAVQQRIESPEQRSYFQYRLLQDAVARLQALDVSAVIPRSRLLLAHAAHAVSLVMLGLVLWQLATEPRLPGLRPSSGVAGLEVTPGDTEIEKGESLVVLARFGDALPAGVDLVLQGGPGEPRVPLVRSMADPVFGGSVAGVQADFVYYLEYNGTRTRDYTVKVFEHPRLERADADLVYPAYTQLEAKRIENTRRLSAVEGSRLTMTLQLNKPVRSATLIPRGEEGGRLPLTVTPGAATVTWPDYLLETSRTFDLELVDAEGRKNKTPTPLVLDVQPNRTPELRIATPRGDVRPSALEELGFSGTVWDDFGVPAYGVGYTRAGGETVHVELGRDLPGRERRNYAHLLALESLALQPGELLSWFVWADDVGPDGQIRRTMSDLFFAEIRPFDEIFRESQNMAGGNEPQGGQQGNNEQQRLVELQKQIISATWRLQRERPSEKRTQDAGVVLESQQQALLQAESGAAEAFDPGQQALWRAVTQNMKSAQAQLELAAKGANTFGPALAAEQSAYQALLKLEARETSVTRGGQRGQQGGGGRNQRQIDQLDLAQAENRYETQRQARAPQSPERREEMQVINRLQELARRQEDFNERLRELQTALQEARTEQEREELRRQLKRLQEEQQQMLADADELQQRMNRPENQSRMSEQREQLEQTRDELQRAAEAAGEGNVAQALASGTRAQRDLQQMRDELRRENSSQFAEDLRQMRSEARDLARDQEALSERLGSLGQSERRTLSDTGDRAQVRQEMQQQQERMRELFERATEISSQAESTEPLLSRQLYESLRRTNQEESLSFRELQEELLRSGRLSRAVLERLQQGASSPEGGKSLGLVNELLEDGMLPQAAEAERRARAGIEELVRGVERAAESVIGDDAEALRLAQQELEDVTEQLRRERAQAGGEAGEATPGRGNDPSQPGQPGETGVGERLAESGQGSPAEGTQANAGRSPGQPGNEQEGQPGGGTSPGQSQGQGEGQGQLAQNQEGASQGESAQAGGGGAGSPRDGQNRPGRTAARDGQRAGGGANGGGAFEGGGIFGGEFVGNGPLTFPDFADEARNQPGPLTGDQFGEWSDRLRNIEELIDDPALRNEVATARERARTLRREYRENLKKPDWAVVRLEIERPLLEVRSRLAEELARRGSRDPLVPIDRDPVPTRFAEQVRRYYEELGRDPE